MGMEVDILEHNSRSIRSDCDLKHPAEGEMDPMGTTQSPSHNECEKLFE
jgi:hypothetical protein